MNNPQHKLLLRHAILLQLAASSPVPLPAQTLLEGIRLAGYETDKSALFTHLDYLEQKQHIKTSSSELSAADTRYSLSATGRDYLESKDMI